jgi:hypothetical protein
MKFYMVTQKFWMDTGKAGATIEVVEAEKKPKDIMERFADHDRYIEYYDDREKAEQAARACSFVNSIPLVGRG